MNQATEDTEPRNEDRARLIRSVFSSCSAGHWSLNRWPPNSHFPTPRRELRAAKAPAEFQTEKMSSRWGPSHPSTHGVLRLLLELDGEIITKAIRSRLPASRRREDRREHDLQPVRPLHGPAGLSRAAREQHGLRARGRAAREARSARRAARPSACSLRAGAHLGAPARPRRFRHGCGRDDGVPATRSPSARSSTTCSRRSPARGSPRATRASAACRATCPKAGSERVNAFCDQFLPIIDEIAEAAHAQPDLRGPHGRRRRHLEGGRDRLRPDRPEPARLAASATTCARPIRTRLRAVRVRRAGRLEGRLLRPLPRAHGGDAPDRAHPPAGDREVSRRRRGTRRMRRRFSLRRRTRC